MKFLYDNNITYKIGNIFYIYVIIISYVYEIIALRAYYVTEYTTITMNVSVDIANNNETHLTQITKTYEIILHHKYIPITGSSWIL